MFRYISCVLLVAAVTHCTPVHRPENRIGQLAQNSMNAEDQVAVNMPEESSGQIDYENTDVTEETSFDHVLARIIKHFEGLSLLEAGLYYCFILIVYLRYREFAVKYYKKHCGDGVSTAGNAQQFQRLPVNNV